MLRVLLWQSAIGSADRLKEGKFNYLGISCPLKISDNL